MAEHGLALRNASFSVLLLVVQRSHLAGTVGELGQRMNVMNYTQVWKTTTPSSIWAHLTIAASQGPGTFRKHDDLSTQTIRSLERC